MSKLLTTISSRKDSSENRKSLRTLDGCYHCGKKEVGNIFCLLWEIWACKNCMVNHHQIDHKDCRATVKNLLSQKSESKYFNLTLTRYDGTMFSILCRRGIELPMEDHWLGTYIFFPDTLVLVREDRTTINKKILDALRLASSREG